MVTRHEEHSVWYSCDKCHITYDTPEEADRCERQQPTKQLLRSDSFREETDWEIGDFLLIQKEDKLPELVRIYETTEIRHKIWPVFQHLNYGAKQKWKGPNGEVLKVELYNYDSWHTQWVRVVTDSIKEIIFDWADVLRGENQ